MISIINSDFKENLKKRNAISNFFFALLLFSTLFGLLMLTVLIVDIAVEGVEWLRPELFLNFHSRKPEQAGLKSAIVGSMLVLLLIAIFSFPIGVGAAIYLEEYAPKNRFTRFINISINNLAGVPSIVYGMLGLVLFGRMFDLFRADSWLVKLLKLPVGRTALGGLNFDLFGIPWLEIRLPFGRSLLAGSLTMTLLILPVVIIAARESIRSVPSTIKEASYGLGATKWQTVSHHVIPIALPGILTGMILALSRAIGEAAPLLIMGAFSYVPFLPKSVWDQFTVMPIQIYNWITMPQEPFRVNLAAAGIIVLLVILLSFNAIAIYLRKKFEIKW